MRCLCLMVFSLLLSSLTGCIHHLDVQQGNIVSSKTVQELKLGMSQTQVENLLGTPVLVQSFSDRISYIYTWRSDETPFHEKSLILYFSNGRLVSYQNNLNKPH